MKSISENTPSSFYPSLTYDTERLQFAMHAAGVGIWELNTETNEVAWDDHCREFFGLAKDNTIPFEKAIQFIHPDDYNAVISAVERALAGKDNGKYDMRYRTIGADDGKLRWVHFSGQAYFDDQGKVTRFGGIAQDITAYTIAINEAKQILQDAVDLAKLATWSVDVTKARTSYSERMSEWLGVDAAGRDLEKGLAALNDEDRERVRAAILWAMEPESGGVFDLEYGVVNQRTGRKRIIHSQARTFFDESGKALKIVGTALDVTHEHNLRLTLEQQVQQRTEELDATNEELKASNEELLTINDSLAHLNEQLEMSNENLNHFAHVASHDLKEPVRKIKTFLGMVTSDPDSALSNKAQLLLQRVTLATDRMFSMINGVLAYSAINSTNHAVQLVNLQDTVRTVITDLELMIEEKKAVIEYDRLPSVEGADILLYQLFSNLILNALKFSRKDVAPVIRLTSVEQDFVARIVVSDNGLGFSQEQAEQIFQLFSRLHSKDKYEGTGLGLSLCRKIVQRHDGTIEATGQPQHGAVFTITLPFRQSRQFI